MRWTLVNVPLGASCGSCGARVPEGEPIALVTPLLKRRCRDCAPAPLSDDVLAALRAEHDAARLAAASERLEARAGRSPYARAPVPVSAIAPVLFDPKEAAANDRE